MDEPQRHPRWAEARWLLLISGIFSLSIGLSNTFVNIYLWKVDQSYTSIGWYNLAIYICMPGAFILAGWIANRAHTVMTLRIGILLHAVFYLLVLLGGTMVARLPIFLGAIMGAAGGFYWYSFNMLSLRLTESQTRDRFYGLNGAMVAIANTIAPLLSGFLIAQEDKFGPLSGYHIMFGFSLALFLAASSTTVKLRSERTRGQINFRNGFQLTRRTPWRQILIGCFMYGLREGVFLFLIGLLMYLASGSELRLGEFLFLQNFLSFLSFYTVGRMLKPERRISVLGFGSLAMAAAALLFIRPLTITNIILYGVAIAIALPAFIVPLQGMIFDTISSLDESGNQHDEQIIAREVAENAGRAAGIAAFLVVTGISPSARLISDFAVVLGFVQVVSWVIIRRGFKEGGGKNRGNRGEARRSQWLFDRQQSPS